MEARLKIPLGKGEFMHLSVVWAKGPDEDATIDIDPLSAALVDWNERLTSYVEAEPHYIAPWKPALRYAVENTKARTSATAFFQVARDIWGHGVEWDPWPDYPESPDALVQPEGAVEWVS